MGITIRSWRDGAIQESNDVDELGRLISGGSRTWIDLTNPRPELVAAVARRLGLHALLAEDILERNERAKVELVGDVIHLVTFALERNATPGGEVRTEEVDFVLGRNFLVSVHGPGWDPASVRQVGGLGAVLERGTDYLLWVLVDAIVDGYFPVFDRLGDEIDAVQDAVLVRPTRETIADVFRLKRELIRIRHVLAPSREVFAQLTSRELGVIRDSSVFEFRDVYDHLIQLNAELDTFRELVADSVEVYLSTINNNLSTIMKRLTGVTVILAGIGAIGGLFGMSEAAGALAGTAGGGFYLVVAAVVVASVAAVVVLRRIDWL